MAIDEYEQQIQAATAAALRGERVRWRVEAVWPLALYGLDTPFRVPPHWESEGSGAGFGERDAAWWTGPLTEAEVQAEIDKIELPIDVAITKEARPDDAE